MIEAEENGGGRNKVPSSDFDIVYDVGFQRPLSSSSPDMKINVTVLEITTPHSAALQLQEIHRPLVRVASAASPAQVLPEEEEEEVEEPAVTAPGPERITFPSDDEDEDEEKSTTAVLPEDISLPALFDEDDIPFINPSHYIIGTDILEAFVVKQYDVAAPLKKTQKKLKPDFRAGSVAFRCRYCKYGQRKKQPNSTIYPESLEGLYRANLRFQSNHVRKCDFIPQWIRMKLHRVRQNSNGHQRLDHLGIRDYWVETAARKGFRNAEGKKMLTFSLP